MPTFAVDLGHGDPGAAYTALLGADAAGALTGGILLESGRSLFRTETSSALKLAALWACALGAFALVTLVSGRAQGVCSWLASSSCRSAA